MLFAPLIPPPGVAVAKWAEVAITDHGRLYFALAHITLVDAFHATLEEVQESDLLIHVDASQSTVR